MSSSSVAAEGSVGEIPGSCPHPLDLGRAGWDILHTTAAVYPHKPSAQQKDAMRSFIYSWSQLYACSFCAYHMRVWLKDHPPVVSDKLAVNRYMCELHNEVNRRVGYDVYDCDPMKVLKRWHPTYPNMDDQPTIEEQIEAQREAERAKKAAEMKAKEDYQAWLASVGKPKRLSAEEWRGKASAGEMRTGWSSGAATVVPPPPSTTREESTPQEPSAASSTRKWWFFGTGSAVKSLSDSTVMNPHPSHDVRSLAPASAEVMTPQELFIQTTAPRGGKVLDGETNVEDVLRRLKTCQVYCPENQQAQTH